MEWGGTTTILEVLPRQSSLGFQDLQEIPKFPNGMNSWSRKEWGVLQMHREILGNTRNTGKSQLCTGVYQLNTGKCWEIPAVQWEIPVVFWEIPGNPSRVLCNSGKFQLYTGIYQLNSRKSQEIPVVYWEILGNIRCILGNSRKSQQYSGKSWEIPAVFWEIPAVYWEIPGVLMLGTIQVKDSHCCCRAVPNPRQGGCSVIRDSTTQLFPWLVWSKTRFSSPVWGSQIWLCFTSQFQSPSLIPTTPPMFKHLHHKAAPQNLHRSEILSIFPGFQRCSQNQIFPSVLQRTECPINPK